MLIYLVNLFKKNFNKNNDILIVKSVLWILSKVSMFSVFLTNK